VNDLIKRYSPQWLYLGEFMDALPGSNIDEKKEAIILLIRDRLIINGAIDETHFRFLGGKPPINVGYWLANFSYDDVSWDESTIRAPAGGVADIVRWYLIEIAASGLTLFASDKGGKGKKPTRNKASPEQERALKALHAIYGDRIPPQNEVSNKVLEKIVNDRLHADGLQKVKPDALQRAAGRRR
jgi:hypothetical protein